MLYMAVGDHDFVGVPSMRFRLFHSVCFYTIEGNFFLKSDFPLLCSCVEYVRTGDGSDFWHVQDESGFSDPHCSQTIGHRGY